MLAINSVLNRIHVWGEPSQHPATRMFFTRIANVGSAILEGLAIVYGSLNVGLRVGDAATTVSLKMVSTLLPHRLKNNLKNISTSLNDLTKNLLYVCKLIIGLASTIFFGIVFSPELNFRIHILLGLVVDNMDRRKQNELRAKVEADAKAVETTKERAARFAQFQSQRRMAREQEEQENAIDANLAEILLSTCKPPEVKPVPAPVTVTALTAAAAG